MTSEQAIVHKSDCAVHNEPAYPSGPCTCGATVTPQYAIARLREFQNCHGLTDCWNKIAALLESQSRQLREAEGREAAYREALEKEFPPIKNWDGKQKHHVCGYCHEEWGMPHGIQQLWNGSERPCPRRLLEFATPTSALHQRLLDVAEAAEELMEVAKLRGDNDLPHPADDAKLWTARMQDAWDEMDATLSALQGVQK